MKKIKIWNAWFIAVLWNKPWNKPIPLSAKFRWILLKLITRQQTNIVIRDLEYKIDLSRLVVTAFEHKKGNTLKISKMSIWIEHYTFNCRSL